MLSLEPPPEGRRLPISHPIQREGQLQEATWAAKCPNVSKQMASPRGSTSLSSGRREILAQEERLGLDCFRFIFLPKIKAWEDNCRNIKRDFGKFPENASCELRPGSGPEGGGSGSRLHQAGSLLLTGSRPHGAGMAASAHAPAGPYLPRPAMPCTTGLAQCGTQRPHRRR